MRLLLLLCATLGMSHAMVTSLLSTLYDVYDFDKGTVYLYKCESGCVIYAATMADTFDQYPDKIDPYGRNLIIHDINKGEDIMSIAELAAKVDPSTKVKGRLEIQGSANITVINKNAPDAKKFTVVLHVIETAHGGGFPHAVYDIADVASTVLTTNTRNVTFISARPYRLEAERGDKPNNVSIVLAGFDSWWSSDYCPVVFETRKSTPENPFPGFVVQPNTPLLSLFMGQWSQIVLRPSFDFEHSRQLCEDGFITSPGWNGCTKPDRGGIQTFRSPFDKPTDSYFLAADDLRNVDLHVRPNFDAYHELTVGLETHAFNDLELEFGGVQLKDEYLNGAKNLNFSFTDLSGSQGFIATYYSDPISAPASWVAPESYCDCAVTAGESIPWGVQNINLDIVLIIDTSAAMEKRLHEAKKMIRDFVPSLTTDPRKEFYSKIGVIAASNTAEIIYNMNMTYPYDLEMVKPVVNLPAIDFDIAFATALQILLEAQQDKSRAARPIIYFLTNSEAPSNVQGADWFKGFTYKKGIIIVNEFMNDGESPKESLKSLASDHYFFTDLSKDYENNWGVLCEASCFCHPNSTQIHAFNDDSISPRTEANRGCFQAFNDYETQAEASKSCRSKAYQGHGALVSIHDQQKEFFVNSVASEFGSKTKYWLGLQNNGTAWNWNDKSTSSFSEWDANQPNTDSGKKQCAYAVQTTGLNVRWTAADCGMDGVTYVCETAPCSVGNTHC